MHNIYEIDVVIIIDDENKPVTITFLSDSSSISVVNDEFETWAANNSIEVFEINRVEKVSIAISKDTVGQSNEVLNNMIKQSQREDEGNEF